MQVIVKKSRGMRALLATTLTIAASVVALPVAAPASAAGAIAFDDFSGTVRGTRSYEVAGDSTFTQSGGTGNIKLEKRDGNGSVPTVTLTYAMGPTNLKSTTNGQLFLDLLDIEGGAGFTAVSISATVTDSSGGSSVYNSGIGATPSHGFVLNYDCTAGQTACFKGTADLADITTLSVMFMHGSGNAAAPAVTLRVAGITSTPLGGARPDAPTPVVVTGAPAVVGADGGETSFDVEFRSGASVASLVGLSAPAVSVAGATSITTRVTGPSTVTVTTRVPAGAGARDLTVMIPAGSVTDTWGQQNTNAFLTHRVRWAAAPSWSGPARRAVLAGSVITGSLETWPQAQGESGVTHTIRNGALPTGAVLSSAGVLVGIPSAAGSFNFTVAAEDGYGVSRTKAFTLDVVGATSVAPVSLVMQQDASFERLVPVSGFGTDSEVALSPAIPGVTVAREGQDVKFSGSAPALGTHVSELVISRTVGSDTVVTSRTPVSIQVGLVPTVTEMTVSLRAGRAADVVLASLVGATSVGPISGSVPGMTISVSANSLSLQGTPTTRGVFDVVVQAANEFGTASKTIQVEVVAPRATTVVTPAGGATQTVVEGGTVSFDVVQDADGLRPVPGADVLTADDVLTSGVDVAKVAVAATANGYRVDVTLAPGAVDGELVVTLPDGATVDPWGAASLAGSGKVLLTIQHAPVSETVKAGASVTGAGTPADPFRVPADGSLGLTLEFGGTPVPTLTLESVTSVAAGLAGGGAAMSAADLVARVTASAPLVAAPAGLTFVDNGDGTGTVTGKLAAGTYDVAVRATNTVASVVRTVRVQVAAQPAVVPTPTVPPTGLPTPGPTPVPTPTPTEEPTSTPTDDATDDPSDDVVPDGDADGDSDGASDGDESLPVTGAAVGGLAALSLLLVAGGALLLVWRRKVA